MIGGGIAGISAGIAAARAGKKVCLVEREYMLGRLATLGLVAIYLPLCDGNGNQMISGISEELLKQSVAYGSGEIPECWTPAGDRTARKEKRYRTQFEPASFAYALDQYIHELGIDIMFGTLFSNVIMQEDEIKYLVLENKEGRFALQADMVIDATGDADVCYLAGENTELYTENRKTGWYYSISESEGYRLNILNEDLRKPIGPDSKGYGGIYCHEISEFVLESRKMIFEHRKMKNEGSTVAQIPAIPQLRMARRLKGIFQLDEKDERVYFSDSIGMFGDWRKCGPVYYLPFSALYGKAIVKCVGGKENIVSITVCMTRLRTDIKDLSKVDRDTLEKTDSVNGVQISGNYIQIILGPGKVNKVYKEILFLTGLQETSYDAEALKAEYKEKNATPFKLLLKKVASIFIPILPAIIACGLVMGVNNIVMKINPGYAASSVGQIMAAIGNAAFSVLPVFVGVTTSKVFGGSLFLGGTLASLMTLPALSGITLFGSPLTPGRGGIISVLLVVIFASWLEKKLHDIIPDIFDTFLTPLLTILIAGFVALFLLQPAGAVLSDIITQAVKLALEKGGMLAGAVFSILWLPLVMTGLHHSIIPLHAELIKTVGYTPLLPIFAMVGPGQIGAVIYVYTKTKSQRLKKVILSGIPVQIMGIGEPLIYGVTLPLLKPFIAACLSAGVGGALSVKFSLHSVGMGLSGFPLTLMLNKPAVYICIMLLVSVISFFLTKILGIDDVDY